MLLQPGTALKVEYRAVMVDNLKFIKKEGPLYYFQRTKDNKTVVLNEKEIIKIQGHQFHKVSIE